MIPLAIAGGVLLLLFLLLITPVRADISFSEEFSLDVKYLFITLHLLPAKEKEAKEEAPKEKGEKPSGKIKAILKKQGFSGFLQALYEAVTLAVSTSKKLLSRLKLKRFDLYMCLGGGDDAAQSAMLYGKVSGAVYSACGVLFGLFSCKKKAVTVDLDYNQKENLVNFSGRISILPLFVLKEALTALIRAIPILKKFR